MNNVLLAILVRCTVSCTEHSHDVLNNVIKVWLECARRDSREIGCVLLPLDVPQISQY